MGQTALIPFAGSTIPTTLIDGVVHVAMKPLSEAIGLSWQGQHARLRRHPVFKTCINVTLMQVPGDRQQREYVVLPLPYLNGWLFTASAERARADVRERLIEYQRECFIVLDAYWRRGAAFNPRFALPDTERPYDGLGKTTGARFAEERRKFEAREGIDFINVISRLGVLSKARLRAIEESDTRIDDKLWRTLIGCGFDLHYILYGERTMTDAERAVRDRLRVADADDRAALLAHAGTIEIQQVEVRDAYGETVYIADQTGRPLPMLQ